MLHLTVFCGASPGHHPVHMEAATAFGRLLVEADLGLVHGGASTGLMGALADAVLSNGGRAIGVMPHDLVRHEVAHAGLTQLHVVDSMHERKARMADLGDAFVALPGGFGTAEELFEILTWAQLGLHDKPCALLDTDGFYAPLLAFLRHAVNEGFIHQRYLDNVIVCDRPQDVLVQLTKHRALPHLFETA